MQLHKHVQNFWMYRICIFRICHICTYGYFIYVHAAAFWHISIYVKYIVARKWILLINSWWCELIIIKLVLASHEELNDKNCLTTYVYEVVHSIFSEGCPSLIMVIMWSLKYVTWVYIVRLSGSGYTCLRVSTHLSWILLIGNLC